MLSIRGDRSTVTSGYLTTMQTFDNMLTRLGLVQMFETEVPQDRNMDPLIEIFRVLSSPPHLSNSPP
jgi:hypothetical protein